MNSIYPGDDKEMLSHPIAYIAPDWENTYKDKMIVISDEIINNLEHNPNKGDIIMHYTKLKQVSESIKARLDALDTKDKQFQQKLNQLRTLFKNQQTHYRKLDILTTIDAQEKAIKQLEYGLERYKFLSAENIHTSLGVLKEKLLSSNELRYKRDPMNRERQRKVIEKIMDTLENTFDEMKLSDEHKWDTIKTHSISSTVRSDMISSDTYNADVEMVLWKMEERNDLLERLEIYESYNKESPHVKNNITSIKNEGEIAEFAIWLLTQFPYFTYHFATYKNIRDTWLTPIFYLNNDKNIYE